MKCCKIITVCDGWEKARVVMKTGNRAKLPVVELKYRGEIEAACCFEYIHTHLRRIHGPPVLPDIISVVITLQFF